MGGGEVKEFELTIKSGVRKPKGKIRINITRISRVTGYSKSHISRVISGETVPSLTCLREMAKVIGMGIEELNESIEKRRFNVKTGKG